QPVEGAAVSLGGAAGTGVPLRALGWAGRRASAVGVGPGSQVCIDGAGGVGIAAALSEARHPHDPDGPVEPDRDHVADPARPARRIGALAVDAAGAGRHQRGGGAARAHPPGMPQPLVDALAILGHQASGTAFIPATSFPRLGLELFLEGLELGERRIRIRLAVAPVLARPRSLDEGGAQLRIAVGTVLVAVAPALTALGALGTAALGAPALAFRTAVAIVRALEAGALAFGAWRAPLAPGFARGRLRRRTLRRGRGGGRGRGGRGLGRPGRASALARFAARAMRTALATALGAS